jgi:MoxR-like ATPase
MSGTTASTMAPTTSTGTTASGGPQAPERVSVAGLIARARATISSVVRGKDSVVELCLVAVVAGGHILLEDVPGVGKTTLATAIATALGGSFNRIQFTSDLLPGDILGVSVLESDRSGFRFRPGPLFANVVLADEINRATPKTQSALLEAMNERRVTVDGFSHPLPTPFLVLATQNPHDFHGTFPLPDSQLDRFLLRLEAALSPDELDRIHAAADEVLVHAEVEDYLLELVSRTRADARLIRGASTRGAEALYRATRALALVRGRPYVIPEDVRELAVPVLAHRVLPRAEGDRSGEGAALALQELLWELPAPG